MRKKINWVLIIYINIQHKDTKKTKYTKIIKILQTVSAKSCQNLKYPEQCLGISVTVLQKCFFASPSQISIWEGYKNFKWII